MHHMNSLVNQSFIYVILGVIFILIASVSICVGKTLGRFGVSASRTTQPTQFWWGVVLYFLGGIFCICIWLRSFCAEPIFHPELWLHLK
jgi:hypothetical protein